MGYMVLDEYGNLQDVFIVLQYGLMEAVMT